MAKLIRFDLPINGTKVKSLDELRENMTVEILEHYKAGRLEKWLRMRGYDGELTGLKQVADENDASLLKRLFDIFGIEADDFVIAALLKPEETSNETNQPATNNREESLNSEENSETDFREENLFRFSDRIREGLRKDLDSIMDAISIIENQHERSFRQFTDTKFFIFKKECSVHMYPKPALGLSSIQSLYERIKLNEPEWTRVIDAQTIIDIIIGTSSLIGQYRNLNPGGIAQVKIARMGLINNLMEGELLFVKEPRKLGELLVGISELLQNPLGGDGRRNHPGLLKTLESYPELVKREEAFMTYIKLVGTIGAE